MRKRQLTVPMGPSAGPLEVHVAPGYLTALAFDVPLARDGVKLEGPRERLARWDVTERVILLEPAAELPPGEPLLLKVRLADGLAPDSVTLALVTHPSEVDSQVKVTRQHHTTGELLAELNETRAQLEAARQELLGLRARCMPGSLAALALGGTLSKDELRTGLTQGTFTGDGLELINLVTTHRLYGRLTLFFKLENLDTASSWKPDTVRMVHGVKRVPVELVAAGLDRPRLAPGETGILAVELREEELTATPHLLQLDFQDDTSGRSASWRAGQLQ